MRPKPEKSRSRSLVPKSPSLFKLGTLSINGKSSQKHFKSIAGPIKIPETGSPLLDLPGEIRELIYIKILSHWHISFQYLAMKDTRVHPKSEYVQRIRLFHVNRQIRGEALAQLDLALADFEFGTRLDEGEISKDLNHRFSFARPARVALRKSGKYHAIPNLFLDNVRHLYCYPAAASNQDHKSGFRMPKFTALETFAFRFDCDGRKMNVAAFEEGKLDEKLIESAINECVEASRRLTVIKWAPSVLRDMSRKYEVLLEGTGRNEPGEIELIFTINADKGTVIKRQQRLRPLDEPLSARPWYGTEGSKWW